MLQSFVEERVVRWQDDEPSRFVPLTMLSCLIICIVIFCQVHNNDNEDDIKNQSVVDGKVTTI